MSDTKILQAISSRLALMDKKIDDGFKKVDENFKKVNDRLDKQGASLSYLEDDTPTIKDFNRLEKRVKKLEVKVL